MKKRLSVIMMVILFSTTVLMAIPEPIVYGSVTVVIISQEEVVPGIVKIEIKYLKTLGSEELESDSYNVSSSQSALNEFYNTELPKEVERIKEKYGL